jgi:hypothetical protein
MIAVKKVPKSQERVILTVVVLSLPPLGALEELLFGVLTPDELLLADESRRPPPPPALLSLVAGGNGLPPRIVLALPLTPTFDERAAGAGGRGGSST